jgi:hypothetical protein
MTKKKNARQPKSTSAKTKHKFTDNSAAAQRAKLLDRLLIGPLTTLEARRPPLDILHPAARVHELRHRAGHNILMTWIRQPTEAGRLHRVALYSMQPGKWEDA